MSGFSKKLRLFLTGVLRALPIFGMGAAVIWFFVSGRELSVEELLSYTPAEPLLAALFLWLAFAAKSLSLMFPVLLLFAVAGRLFPLPLAFLVNTVGIALTLSIPYMVGRFSGKDLTERLMDKYPRLKEARELRSSNNFFFAFLIRAVGILPCDVVSLYLGNTRMPYLQYILGGVLGFLPDLICATIVGMKMSDWRSPWFWLTIAVNIFICAVSLVVYRLYRRRLNFRKEREAHREG